MRAFLNRLKVSTGTKERPPGRDGEREKSINDWQPSSRPMSLPPSEFKALPPVIVDTALPPMPELEKETNEVKAVQHDSTGRSSARANSKESADHPKKVAFLSPPRTPAAAQKSQDTTTTLPEERRRVNNSDPLPARNAVAKLIALHDGRASTSTSASTPPNFKISVSSDSKTPTRGLPSSPTQSNHRIHASTTPAFDGASLMAPSLRAGTPFSQMSQRSGVLATASWSEAAEEDLVSNIGQRERTRQEVLWEIVASEERYVHELLKMKETFIDPLLHPFADAPATSPLVDGDMYRSESPVGSIEHLPIASRFTGAASLRSETPQSPPTASTYGRTITPVIPTPDNESDTEHEDIFDTNRTMKPISAAAKAAHPRSPYGTATRSSGINLKGGRPILQFPTRSHQSLPPPARMTTVNGAVSTASLGRPSGERPSTSQDKKNPGHANRVLRKLRKGTGQEDPKGIPPHLLPEDLRRCLEVIENGILGGHCRLSEALRKRYEDQYPLVRSLADVFVTHSVILNEYATYVLHLERALEQADSALSSASVAKKPKHQDEEEWSQISKHLIRLEKSAADKGETGLAISLSKPFQRLLKYPLLFQNLLFHTDPSTFEYESTLQMVAEVESIVRSIEDEKIQKEERDKTRDIFGRIEGLEKDRVFAVWKPSRVLIEERPLDAAIIETISIKGAAANAAANSARTPTPGATAKERPLRNKSSFRRISEVLQPSAEKGMGGKKDLWLVVFNDVVLRCQRVGSTSLPLGIPTNSRTNSLPDMQGKTKYPSNPARRTSVVRARNLYRFVKVESWTINQKPAPKGQDLVKKEDIEKSRAQIGAGNTADETEEDMDSDDSDRKSKMSFSYWGADKVTLTKPMTARRVHSSTNNRVGGTAIRVKPQAPSSFAGRESAKDAKFGTRMRSPEPSQQDGSVAVRPGSRRTNVTSPVSVATTRRAVMSSEDSKNTANRSATTVATKPAWDVTSRSPPVATTTPPIRRVRNTSLTSGQAPSITARATNPKVLSSPAPSEDSGVGMYRQIIAHDPSINKT